MGATRLHYRRAGSIACGASAGSFTASAKLVVDDATACPVCRDVAAGDLASGREVLPSGVVLPCPWAAWAERHAAQFRAWATEPLVLRGADVRYAVIQPEPGQGLVWVRLLHGLGLNVTETRRSGGCFYDGADDHPEGAVAWASEYARMHAGTDMASDQNDTSPAPPGPTADYFPKSWARPGSPGALALCVPCPRCSAKVGAACQSIGQDSYLRGAPCRRMHAERLKAGKAAQEVSLK